MAGEALYEGEGIAAGHESANTDGEPFIHEYFMMFQFPCI